jgi:predicted nucleotidyltransferase
MNKPRIPVATALIAALCRGRRIRRLAVFSSFMHDDFWPDGDVDPLDESEPCCARGWEIVGMEDALSSLFGGRKVDLVTNAP